MQNENKTAINIIQGDSCVKEIQIVGLSLDLIEGLYFSCEKLNLCKKLELQDDIYVLEFTSEETMNFPKIYTTFDLTINFVGGSTKTVLFCDSFNVYEKRNKVGCL